MGDIHHDERADLFRNLAELCEVEDSRIGARADNDQLRSVVDSQSSQRIEVHLLRRPIHTVREYLEKAAGKVDRAAVRQMPARAARVTPLGAVSSRDKRGIE